MANKIWIVFGTRIYDERNDATRGVSILAAKFKKAAVSCVQTELKYNFKYHDSLEMATNGFSGTTSGHRLVICVSSDIAGATINRRDRTITFTRVPSENDIVCAFANTDAGKVVRDEY